VNNDEFSFFGKLLFKKNTYYVEHQVAWAINEHARFHSRVLTGSGWCDVQVTKITGLLSVQTWRKVAPLVCTGLLICIYHADHSGSVGAV